MVHHDSHLSRYREPLGPIPAGGQVCIRFLCNESDTVTLRTWDGSEHLFPMTLTENHLFEVTLTMPETPMLYWYDFIIHGKDGDLRYGNSGDQLGGEGFVCNHQPASYQITVYDPAYHTPEYIRHGVVYQIFRIVSIKTPSVRPAGRRKSAEPIRKPLSTRSGTNVLRWIWIRKPATTGHWTSSAVRCAASRKSWMS